MIDNTIGTETLDAPLPVNGDQAAAQLAREITDQIVANLPAEKRKAEQDMLKTAKELEARGSDWADGRGQAIGSIPPRIYMRWALLLPGCWQDRQFVMEFLKDNPQCRAPGFKISGTTDLRHGFSVGASFYQQNKAKVTND